MKRTTKKTLLSILIIAFSVILDQVTKIICKNFLEGNEDVTVIPKILGFSYVENRGAAFGIFADNRWIFMIFSTVAILAMIYFLFSRKSENMFFIISISFLIGGGIGNMIDRIARGYVVDFFKLLFVKFAVFNVADCFVTVGAFLLAVYLIFYFEEDSDLQSESEKRSASSEALETHENSSSTND